MRIGIVVPHIFMQRDILPDVLFSPGQLALSLADELVVNGVEVTLYTPGPVDTSAQNVTADLSLFKNELMARGDTYIDLLKKHPGTFIALARQIQSELLSTAFYDANADKIDLVHVYTNEEDIALPFSKLCRKPVLFTHHDPFNFLVKYKNNFPKYKDLNWLALSEAQKKGMPEDTNWLATIYHGLPREEFKFSENPNGNYIAFLGRIIRPKGVHLAIESIKLYNKQNGTNIKLKIAGKHYSGHAKDSYWQDVIKPELGGDVEYVGYIDSVQDKQEFLGNAQALIIPSIFDEPFGLVMAEALACGTPVIGLDSGAISEVIKDRKTGILVQKENNENETIESLSKAISSVDGINRQKCRTDFEARFTLERMCREHLEAYGKVLEQHQL